MSRKTSTSSPSCDSELSIIETDTSDRQWTAHRSSAENQTSCEKTSSWSTNTESDHLSDDSELTQTFVSKPSTEGSWSTDTNSRDIDKVSDEDVNKPEAPRGSSNSKVTCLLLVGAVTWFGVMILVSLLVVLYVENLRRGDVVDLYRMVISGQNFSLDTFIEKEDVKQFHPDAFVAPFDYLAGTTPDGESSFVIFLKGSDAQHTRVVFTNSFSGEDEIFVEPFDFGEIDPDTVESVEITVKMSAECQCCSPTNLGTDCTSDLDCGLQEICGNDGICEHGCNDDSRCFKDEVCRNDFCITEGLNPDKFEEDFYSESCFSEDDCNERYICQNGNCVYGCKDDSECEAGLVCRWERCVNENNVFEDNGCFSSVDCEVRHKCEFGECVPGCDYSSDCYYDEKCEDGVCIPDEDSDDDDFWVSTWQCDSDSDCQEEEICDYETCMNGCRDDSGCIGDRECFYGFCYPPDEPSNKRSSGQNDEKKGKWRKDEEIPFYLRDYNEVECHGDWDCLRNVEICREGFCIGGCRRSSDCTATDSTRKYCRRNICVDEIEYLFDPLNHKEDQELPEWSDSTFFDEELNRDTWVQYWRNRGVQNYPSFDVIAHHRYGHMYDFRTVTETSESRRLIISACGVLLQSPWSAAIVFTIVVAASQLYLSKEIIQEEARRRVSDICEPPTCEDTASFAVPSDVTVGDILVNEDVKEDVDTSKPSLFYCGGHCVNNQDLTSSESRAFQEYCQGSGYYCEDIWAEGAKIEVWADPGTERMEAKARYLIVKLMKICREAHQGLTYTWKHDSSPTTKEKPIINPCTAVSPDMKTMNNVMCHPVPVEEW